MTLSFLTREGGMLEGCPQQCTFYGVSVVYVATALCLMPATVGSGLGQPGNGGWVYNTCSEEWYLLDDTPLTIKCFPRDTRFCVFRQMKVNLLHSCLLCVDPSGHGSLL